MRRLIVSTFAISLALTACGGDGSEGESSTTEGETTVTTSAKPEVTVPDSPPPTELVVNDLKEGTGDAAEPGDFLEMNYVGVSYSTKKEFDSSYDRGQPFGFPLGAGRVIKGWDQGVVGMKVGGRRELIIPPALGYGAAGAGADIAPNETLIFVIELVSINGKP